MTLSRNQILVVLALICAACTSQQAAPTITAIPPSATPEPSHTPSAVPGSPTPSATLPPGPQFFTEDFNAKPSYWSFLQIDNGQPFAGPVVRDGFLAFDLTAPNQWAYALYGPHVYGDTTIETQAQFRTNGDGAVGLVCRYDEQKGWYELNVYADRTYQLLFGQWLAEGVARYTPLFRASSEKIKPDENRIGLRCQGHALTPVFNGTPMRIWQDLKFGLQEGRIGLVASSFGDAPYTVAFDWAKVSKP